MGLLDWHPLNVLAFLRFSLRRHKANVAAEYIHLFGSFKLVSVAKIAHVFEKNKQTNDRNVTDKRTNDLSGTLEKQENTIWLENEVLHF